jgi:DNA invertase Pin-like site-specific DNA recombinase
MNEPDEVAAVVRMHALGWGSRRIARELGISRNTVERFLAWGGCVVYCRSEGAGASRPALTTQHSNRSTNPMN